MGRPEVRASAGSRGRERFSVADRRGSVPRQGELRESDCWNICIENVEIHCSTSHYSEYKVLSGEYAEVQAEKMIMSTTAGHLIWIRKREGVIDSMQSVQSQKQNSASFIVRPSVLTGDSGTQCVSNKNNWLSKKIQNEQSYWEIKDESLIYYIIICMSILGGVD